MKKSWDLNISTTQQTPNIKPGFVEESPPPPITKHNLPVDKKQENKASQGSITIGTQNSNQVIQQSLERERDIDILHILFKSRGGDGG